MPFQENGKECVKLEWYIDLGDINCNQFFQLLDGRGLKIGTFYFTFRMPSNTYDVLDFITRSTSFF